MRTAETDRWMKRHNLTADKIACAVGLQDNESGRSTAQRWISGQRRPHGLYAAALRTVYGPRCPLL